jgi:putative flippase GtrA
MRVRSVPLVSASPKAYCVAVMLSHRAIRYIVVGGVLTLTYSAVTALLIVTGLCSNRTLASAIVSVGIIPLSYTAHRRWTYPDSNSPGATWPEFVRFLQVYVFTIVMNVGLMALSGEIGLPYWVALVAGWVLIPIMNFILNGLLVFRPDSLMTVRKETQ